MSETDTRTPDRAGRHPGPAARRRWLLAGAFLGAAIAWFAVAALPGLASGPGAIGHGTGVTGAVAGGAAAGCLAGVFRRRDDAGQDTADGVGSGERAPGAGGTGRVVAAIVAGVLVSGVVTFLLPDAGAVDLGGDGGQERLALRIGAAAVVLLATAAGLGLALLAVFGPEWLRACALAVPVVFAQDALDSVVPPVPALDIDTYWLGAVLVGVVLGTSVVLRRAWTWVMWVPALGLVWFGQSLAYALDATLQQVRLGAGFLREYPGDPFLTLGDHLTHTLVDPGEHGAVAIWVIALEVGAATAAWRLRGRIEDAEIEAAEAEGPDVEAAQIEAAQIEAPAGRAEGEAAGGAAGGEMPGGETAPEGTGPGTVDGAKGASGNRPSPAVSTDRLT